MGGRDVRMSMLWEGAEKMSPSSSVMMAIVVRYRSEGVDYGELMVGCLAQVAAKPECPAGLELLLPHPCSPAASFGKRSAIILLDLMVHSSLMSIMKTCTKRETGQTVQVQFDG